MRGGLLIGVRNFGVYLLGNLGLVLGRLRGFLIFGFAYLGFLIFGYVIELCLFWGRLIEVSYFWGLLTGFHDIVLF